MVNHTQVTADINGYQWSPARTKYKTNLKITYEDLHLHEQRNNEAAKQ